MINPKVALVHDFLNQYGGAEKVLEIFAEMFPEAPIYTILYDRDKMSAQGGPASGWRNRDIRTSFFQKLPKFLRRNFKYFMFFLPTAPETFDLREFDLVISSSGAWAKGVITRLDTVHIAYIHSPMRFVWDYNEKYLKDERKGKWGFFIRPILSYFRLWDRLAADRPDYLIANSRYTQARIKKYYRRESALIYPPVNVEGVEIVEIVENVVSEKKQLQPAQRYNQRSGTTLQQKPFLIVSRLSAYKKINAVIEAFNKLELPLIIVGEGKERRRLEAIAGKNVKFLGWQPDEKLPNLYSRARAVISASVEDFGLAAAEALAAGTPVVSIRHGGTREIVEEGKTGEFFEAATPEVIADAVRRFSEKEKSYDREYIRESAKRFGKERFIREFNDFIKKVLK